jgi:hypothetical protein
VKHIVTAILIITVTASGYAERFMRDDFEDLLGWEQFRFVGVAKDSIYRIHRDGDGSFLEIESRGGASSLLSLRSFNVYEYPTIEWRWRVDGVLANGDIARRSGDDYPVRVYVLFRYDPSRIGPLLRLQYNTVRLLYGRYPPHAGINYVWANRDDISMPFVRNAHSRRAVMYVMDAGDQDAGQWRVHRRNIVEDYRRAFGEDPPAEAKVAIMGDGDNTGESERSWLDYIEIRR